MTGTQNELVMLVLEVELNTGKYDESLQRRYSRDPENNPLEQVISLLHLPQIHCLAQFHKNPPICVAWLLHHNNWQELQLLGKKYCQDLTAYLIFHLVCALEALEKHQPQILYVGCSSKPRRSLGPQGFLSFLPPLSQTDIVKTNYLSNEYMLLILL